MNELEVFKAQVWRSLPNNLSYNDKECVDRMLERFYELDYSLGDAIAEAKLTEHVNPHLSEEYACRKIAKIQEKYGNRKETKPTVINGQLEIDHERGVIYFHTTDHEAAQQFQALTILRICSLPKPIPKDRQIDIAHMHGVCYSNDSETQSH